MSVPSPYTQRTSPGDERCRMVPNKIEKKEDCRDYLRTGRCKYGASCKYNHPLNVQSGGGMKAPINPSEPLFPIRYNEPVCQYYMKHGTCKFGQACKFHHPPHIAGTSNLMNGSNTVLGSAPGGGRKEDGGSHLGTMWKGGNDPGVQILPQRPDEPNCIYFLKNGRCKYGATCRYHHPLKYHHDNNRSRNNAFEDGRNSSKNNNRQTQDLRGAPKVHYVAALPPGSMQQGHFVVADGTVTFLSLDGNAPAHVVSISHQAGTGGKDYATVGTVASSTSSTSIASSFETSITNLDTNDLSSGSLWNNRKTSGNVSSAYGLPRVVSTGSTQSDSNSSLFYDSNTGPSTWRGHRSSSFDHTRNRSASHSNQDEMIRSISAHSALDERSGGRPLQPSIASPIAVGGNSNLRDITTTNAVRDQRMPGEVDDGLSMMTSALLTMLDTPTKDVGTLKQNDKYDIDDRAFASSSRSDNQCLVKPFGFNRAPFSLNEDSSREYPNNPSTYHGQPQFFRQNNANIDDQASDLSTALPTTMRSNMNALSGQQKNQSILNQINRIQSWQGSAAAGVIHENVQFSAINPTQQLPSSSPNTSTNVGLYY
mmetsp:Transcript_9533/g.23401  ORF Transcript_9533/g.23401 Transcript_9533/m.23401 type:complete len:594 (-) Transcript_9533:420-2201(-)|eukprot:CAMPEP_0197187344 /NCGR_PEP_ID=MMETSP1423-20130617/15737_1 /TAXON_ID=476441 /ORGANISM="Pseudo-nitzschia heimii, Strain UNC1101" /LENGTH=593 /DNA_ID=CAMNT_0042638901 /DNA_START=330 /DNA_END=2111 /DNA_ORIENTATION=-